MSGPVSLEDAQTLHRAAEDLLDRARDKASALTDGGRRIDDFQVLTQRVAYAATETRAIRELIHHVEQARGSRVDIGQHVPAFII